MNIQTPEDLRRFRAESLDAPTVKPAQIASLAIGHLLIILTAVATYWLALHYPRSVGYARAAEFFLAPVALALSLWFLMTRRRPDKIPSILSGALAVVTVVGIVLLGLALKASG